MNYTLLENEQIKPISDFPNYFITSYGRVWSNLRGGHWLIPTINKRGNHQRYYVNLGRKNRFYVHQLVAQAFLPNPNNYTVIDHIDGNGLNNKVENLRWITQPDNLENPITVQRIQNNGGALVEIEEIATGKCFWGYADAAAYFGVHEETIRNHTKNKVKSPKWRLTGRKKSHNDNRIIE